MAKVLSWSAQWRRLTFENCKNPHITLTVFFFHILPTFARKILSMLQVEEKHLQTQAKITFMKNSGLFLCENERNSALLRTPLGSTLGRGLPFLELQKTWISCIILKISCKLSVLRMNEWQIRGFNSNFRADHEWTLTKIVC